MSYYEAFGLTKEPFSTSPDPAFFFLSRQHRAALCRLRIAITLRRGLCVVLGDVGTGKTTLSRKLAQILTDDHNVLFHLVLNPYFKTQKQFLQHLARLFHLPEPSRKSSGMDLMESIERFLFRKGVEEDKTVVLLVDESQLLPDYVFEILRILLNYETNEYKILQLVLVGQLELLPRISKMHNFWDRIALKCVLRPMDKEELAQTIDFRLTQAGYRDINSLFTDEAIEQIYSNSQGYPRRFTALCHNALESLVMFDRHIVDADVVRRVLASEFDPVSADARGDEDAV